jgi:hypothetical protein
MTSPRASIVFPSAAFATIMPVRAAAVGLFGVEKIAVADSATSTATIEVALAQFGALVETLGEHPGISTKLQDTDETNFPENDNNRYKRLPKL